MKGTGNHVRFQESSDSLQIIDAVALSRPRESVNDVYINEISHLVGLGSKEPRVSLLGRVDKKGAYAVFYFSSTW